MSNRNKKKVLFLIDAENIEKNVGTPMPGRFSRVEGFDRIIKEIAQEVGEILPVFAFCSPQVASLWGEDLDELDFYPVYCPRIKGKDLKERDTVDEKLKKFAVEMINAIPDITHLCLGSGDADFIQLVRKAIRKRMKIMIVAGHLTSLSNKLIKLADKDSAGKRMIYLFSPTED